MKHRLVLRISLLLVVLVSIAGCKAVPGLTGRATSTPQPTATRTATLAPTRTPSPRPTATRTPSPRPTATRTVSPTPRPTRTPTSLPLGPAKVEASMPASIPCSAWGTDGCRWDFTVTFAEVNGNPATIDAIGRRYIDRTGAVWTSTSGEWHDEPISIPAWGTNRYSSWVRTKFDSEGDLRGGTVVVSYRGSDDEGNTFSGNVSAKLEY